MKRMFTIRNVWVLLGVFLSMECVAQFPIAPVRTQLSEIEKAVRIYAMTYQGKIPDSLEDLARDTEDFSSLLKKEKLIDPWGEPIGYEHESRKFVIWTTGPDRKMGTADDIAEGQPESYVKSWKEKLMQSIAGQETNTVQEVTAEPTQPPVGTAKATPNRVPTATAQPPAQPDNPAKTKTAPWKIPLLIGVAVVGSMAAWRFIKNKKI